MQLLNIATIAIELFGAAYFLTALTVHLHHCWVNPPVKAAPIVSDVEFNLLEIIDPCELLLLPPASEPHPFELSLERMPEIETIAAVHQPAATPEPSADALDVEPMIAADDLSNLTIRELKALAKDRRVPGYSRLSKSELVNALA